MLTKTTSSDSLGLY